MSAISTRSNGRALLAAVMLFGAACAFSAPFVLTDTEGVRHSLASHKGKWVVVNFWATWCPPCVDEIAELSALYEARKARDVVVLGVAVQYEDAQAVKDFAREQRMAYPLVLSDTSVTNHFGNVSLLPTTILYNPKGKLVLRRIGPVSKKMLEELLARKRAR